MDNSAGSGCADDTGTPYCTIQAAINAAAGGDTISVAAGTYKEEINVTTQVTIEGANTAVAAGANPGARVAETIIDGGFIVSAAGTKIDGVTIQNGRTSGSVEVGVAVAASNVTIENSIIENVSGPAGSDGISTQTGNNNLTLTNSTVQNNWRGIYLNPGDGHTLTGNLIDANNGVGVGIGSDDQSNLTLTNNTISNHTLEGWGSSAVGANVVATGNTFTSNGVSVAHYGGSQIDAESNYWGTVTLSDVAASVSGDVDYVPWCTDATCATVTGPVHNVTQDTYFSAIQPAIDAATAGDIISCAAGTYPGNIDIDKALTLQSTSGAAKTTLSGTGGYAVIVNADNVVIDGFTITNPTGTTGVYALDHSVITIENNIVTTVGDSESSESAQGIYINSRNSNVATINITDNEVSAIYGGSEHSAKGILIGDTTGTTSLTGLLIENNTITDVQGNISAYPDGGRGAYGILLGHGTAGGDTPGAQILDNIIFDLEGLWAHGIGLEADTPNAVLQGNWISDLVDYKEPSDAVAVMIEDNPSAATVNVENNCFSKLKFGVLNKMAGKTVDAKGNWWGDATGPVHSTNMTGKGAEVSDDVDFAPWLDVACTVTIDLDITRSGGDNDLSWSGLGVGIRRYEVWRSGTNPYLVPDTGDAYELVPAPLIGATIYKDSEPEVNFNQYYVIRAVKADGAPKSAPSNRVGAFHFSIVPGEGT
ncbi:MAG: hypothetical protein GY762_24260 [Proteobacteria bacterium]|nr:hypothetical protein [Pseudomonadota bacterium]